MLEYASARQEWSADVAERLNLQAGLELRAATAAYDYIHATRTTGRTAGGDVLHLRPADVGDTAKAVEVLRGGDDTFGHVGGSEVKFTQGATQHRTAAGPVATVRGIQQNGESSVGVMSPAPP